MSKDIVAISIEIGEIDKSEYVAGDYLKALDQLTRRFDDACEGFKTSQSPELLRLYAKHAEEL